MAVFTAILTLVILLSGSNTCDAQQRRIPIGGIFHEAKNNETMLAFKLAVKRQNDNHHFIFDTNIQYIPPENFRVGKAACAMTEGGVAAIFGPQTRSTASIAESICENLEIPHFQTYWDPTARHSDSKFVFNFYPDAEMLATAFAKMLHEMQWTSFTIIYENEESLIRLQEILKAHGPRDPPVTVRQLPPNNEYRPMLKEILASTESHIVLDCETDRILDVLYQARDVGMLEDYNGYIITSLDAHTLDFGDLKSSRTNITTMRLLSPTSLAIQNAIQDWEEEMPGYNISANTLRTEVALMHDAVKFLADGLKKHEEENFVARRNNHRIETIEMESVPCGEESPKWSKGYYFYNFLALLKGHGISGPIQFDSQGRRTHFTLEILELGKKGFEVTGMWYPNNTVHYTRTYDEIYEQIVDNLAGKMVRVVSRIGAPYLSYTEDYQNKKGNDQFEGYAIDLIDGISKILGFNYEFFLAKDGRYGSYDKKTKKWDGLIKELLDRHADFAICDLTITYDRRSAVDFTMPFMTLGISILYSKPVKQPPDLFSFMSPLSFDVWIYMATAFLSVSIVLYVIARMCPTDWENPHPCNPEPEELENTWDLKNCIWLMLGSVMGQGCDILPKGSATRIATGVWWFFSLIMISSYTANLAAFLTNERMDATIESAEDLAKQTKIKYGGVLGGSTIGFFKDSNFSTYQKMWTVMESTRPKVFTSSNNEGVERVKKGQRQYAFLMESTSIEYVIERNCELTQIGGLLDSKGYGIAMPVNSPYRTAVSGAVLKMQEEGKLHLLKTKWWKEMHGGGACEKKDEDDVANELGIDNVGGVFVVLSLGCASAFGIAILEFLWNVRKVAVHNMISPCEALLCELKFALQICNTSKPVNTKSSESASNPSTAGSEDNRSIAANMLKTAGSFLHLDNMFDKKQ